MGRLQATYRCEGTKVLIPSNPNGRGRVGESVATVLFGEGWQRANMGIHRDGRTLKKVAGKRPPQEASNVTVPAGASVASVIWLLGAK